MKEEKERDWMGDEGRRGRDWMGDEGRGGERLIG